MSDAQTKANPKPPHDEFYVGYLPMPNGHRKFVKTLLAIVLLSTLAIGGIIVMGMRDPGGAVWDTQSLKTWSGTLIEEPYPMLLPDSGTDRTPMFVVSIGKHGAHNQLAAYFGHHVRLAGDELRRSGRRLIELSPEPDAVGEDPSKPPSPAIPLTPSEHATLTGEIVDGKCFLGAMKPGDGMGHRACALLCIAGGLPPMFVADTPDGVRIYPLLLIDGSTRYPEKILGMVGQPVRLEADIITIQGINILQASSLDIVRLDESVPILHQP